MTEPKSTAKYPTLAAALVAFQSKIPVPKKDSSADAGKYSYDYASLDKLTPLILGELSKVGIAYTAAPDFNEIGFGLQAQLMHESGESVGGFYPLGSPNAPAQAIGSAITYARRYALLALTGVAPTGEDDDGKKASEAAESVVAARAKAEEPGKETAVSIRNEMGAIIEGSEGKLTAVDANEIMSDVAPNKDISAWTLTDMKKGRTLLNERLAERSK